MLKRFFLMYIVFIYVNMAPAQNKDKQLYMPVFAAKTNALYWATTTPNLGIEIALSRKWTLDISGNYNSWDFSGHKKLKHRLIQPELRYWLCQRFNGHFFGLHAHYADFNVGGIKMLGWRNRYYQGDLYGGGISYGYHWILGNRWSIEATIGIGYVFIDYDKYKCDECATKIKSDNKNYWGPTKAGLSLIYIIK